MKAINIHQPWASVIAFGEKRFETRSWKTDYRGPLLIHASRTFIPIERNLCDTTPFKSVLASHGISSADQYRGNPRLTGATPAGLSGR